MNYAGWLMTGLDETDRKTILPLLMPLICEHWNLCASVGCGCVVGTGDVVCSEVTHGDRYAHQRSEGPTWSVSVTALEQSVRIDLHWSGPQVGAEFVALRQALLSFDKPLFVMQGSGGNNL